ncbi:hypothetical protein [Sphingomonas mollis]|uniref:Transmembrane protein n=1 Tax=Sphingomonas mollis TaxID=2795726 RepID=A0ABS0XJZ6_9SPHN|nr:hypothetical protein [Sphingomonas sp. BT553]MBJ6120364.1 hypothetical protein [Sphingomonas sp. BT553]
MRRRSWIGLSLLVAVMATLAIMVAGSYYKSVSSLAIQLPMLAVPIAVPLVVASLARRHTRAIWGVTALILAIGWGYVLYTDLRPDQGIGPSFAIVMGWFASVVALCVALLWIVGAAIAQAVHRTRTDP